MCVNSLAQLKDNNYSTNIGLNDTTARRYAFYVAAIPMNNNATFGQNSLALAQQTELHKKLSVSQDFNEFRSFVSHELQSVGLGEWNYIRLDLPRKIAALSQIGVIDPNYQQQYVKEKHYQYDLALDSNQSIAETVFQSQLEDFINLSPYCNSTYDKYHKLLTLKKHYGYHEACYLPIRCHSGDGCFLFSTTSKGVDSGLFTQSAKDNKTQLILNSQAIDIVGGKRYPQYFSAPKKSYQAFTSSKAFLLLTQLVKQDLTVKEAAECNNLSTPDARLELAKIRRMLAVNTNEGAYKKLKTNGYID